VAVARQWRDGVGDRWSLIRDVSKNGSGIAGALLEPRLGTRRGAPPLALVCDRAGF
jgi:hypothetical protein